MNNGFFGSLTGGFSPDRVSEAQQAADAILRANGMSGGIAAIGNVGAADLTQGMAARGALEEQSREQNRILRVGTPVQLTIDGHIDTGEVVAGNPVWILELTVRHEDGTSRSVQLRQIISSAALGGYADGTVSPGRVDPADPDAIAFGDQPWM